ncbi:hypothetical protein BDN71DRAFT_1512923 [Pleurotus eryngii]|uniref:Uncharacterized protein n=1 Tax=Pleurotus eryngii TaxID=5323 RepID=A0A9P6D1A1_PLEER|nr:hypothetical protein BDN71DRAFT_1512923 [Pleurotus eryngii]
MVRDLGFNHTPAVVEHYIDIPPSAHAHRIQVSFTPKKQVVSVERYDLLEDHSSIAAQLDALSLQAQPNGPIPSSPSNRETTPLTDAFVTAEPSPVHSAHPELAAGAVQEVADSGALIDDGTPVDEKDYVPVHLRWVGGGRRNRASYAVPQDIRETYPPNSADRRGWKDQRYYVVVRGYETGIFYDFWAHIKPFGFGPSTMAKAFDCYDSMRDFWQQEERDGNVKLLHRPN